MRFARATVVVAVLPVLAQPQTWLAEQVEATGLAMLQGWNQTVPFECVPLFFFDDATAPPNATQLAVAAGRLAQTWGALAVPTPVTVEDTCFQAAVRDFGQDPVAADTRGKCRIRCESVIDSCGVCGGSSFPRVVVEGGGKTQLFYRRGQDITLRATVEWNNTACRSTHELVYLWETPFPDGVQGHRTSVLSISRRTLPPGGTQSPLKLTVASVPLGKALGSDDMTWSTDFEANLTIVSAPLVATIKGGSRDLPAFYDLVLDASSSFDPDYSPGYMLYFWTCREVESGRVCAIASVAQPIWQIAAADLRPGTAYDFRVLILKGDRSSSASARITISERSSALTVSVATEPAESHVVNPNEQLVINGLIESPDPVTTAWSLFTGVAPFSGAGEEIPMVWGADAFREVTSFFRHGGTGFASLVVPPSTLPATPVEYYTFRLECTSTLNGQTASAAVRVKTNAPPTDGVLVISPAAGHYLQVYGMATSIESWQDEPDDFPLEFRFGYVTLAPAPPVPPQLQQMRGANRSAAAGDGAGERAMEEKAVYLNDRSQAPVLPELRLPPGDAAVGYAFPVFVEARDLWGAVATARADVAVRDSILTEGSEEGDDLAVVGKEALQLAEEAMANGDLYAVFQVVDTLAAAAAARAAPPPPPSAPPPSAPPQPTTGNASNATHNTSSAPPPPLSRAALPPPSLAEDLASSLRLVTETMTLTSMASSRVAYSVALVSQAPVLTTAAVEDCVAVLQGLTACVRSKDDENATSLPCVLSDDAGRDIAATVSNLLESILTQFQPPSTTNPNPTPTPERRLQLAEAGGGGADAGGGGGGGGGGGDINGTEAVAANVTAARMARLVSLSETLLDTMDLVARSLLVPLAPGDTTVVATPAFTMQLYRQQREAYLGAALSVGDTPAQLQLPDVPPAAAAAGGVGAAAAFQTVDAVTTLFSSSLPFFYNVQTAEKSCESRLLGEVGNVTRWQKTGLYRTCSGLPELSAATVSLQFLPTEEDVSAPPSKAVAVEDDSLLAAADNRSKFVVEIPTTYALASCVGDYAPGTTLVPSTVVTLPGEPARAMVGDGSSSWMSVDGGGGAATVGSDGIASTGGLNGTLNCTRWTGQRWILDGIPTLINTSASPPSGGGVEAVIRCEYPRIALTESSRFAVHCSPLPVYDSLELLTVAQDAPSMEVAGLCVGAAFFLVIAVLCALEARELRREAAERSGYVRAAQRTDFAHGMQAYGHRDSDFKVRALLTFRTSHTLGSLFAGYGGDPHTPRERVLILFATWQCALAACVPYFEAPVAEKLCDTRCDCLVDRLTGPQCQYACETTCRSYGQCAGGTAAAQACAADGSEQACTELFGCDDFDAAVRIGQAFGPALLTMVITNCILRAAFGWVRQPTVKAALDRMDQEKVTAATTADGDDSSSADNGRGRRCGCGRRGSAAVGAVGDKKLGGAEEETENEREISARLTTRFDPQYLSVKQLPPATAAASGAGTPQKGGSVVTIAPSPASSDEDEGASGGAHSDGDDEGGATKVQHAYAIVLVSLEFVKYTREEQRVKLVMAELADMLGADKGKLQSCETWSPKEWKEEQRAKKKKEMAQRRRRLRLAGLLGKSSANAKFTKRTRCASFAPHALILLGGVGSLVMIHWWSRHFTGRTTGLWIGAAISATTLHASLLDAAIAMLQPRGPVHFWAQRAVPRALAALKERCCPRDGMDGLDELPFHSSDEDDDDDMMDTITAHAWELYHGKKTRPQRPPTPEPTRPPTPECRQWAYAAAAEVEEKKFPALQFRKELIRERVKVPLQLDGHAPHPYVGRPEVLEHHKRWDGEMARREEMSITAMFSSIEQEEAAEAERAEAERAASQVRQAQSAMQKRRRAMLEAAAKRAASKLAV